MHCRVTTVVDHLKQTKSWEVEMYPGTYFDVLTSVTCQCQIKHQFLSQRMFDNLLAVFLLMCVKFVIAILWWNKAFMLPICPSDDAAGRRST